MVKLLLAIAIAAATASAAQAAETGGPGRVPQTSQTTTSMPRQVAGPVKIRFRPSPALGLALAAAETRDDLAARLSIAASDDRSSRSE